MSRQVCREAARPNHSNTPWNLNNYNGLDVFLVTDFLKKRSRTEHFETQAMNRVMPRSGKTRPLFIRYETEQSVAITIARKWPDGLNTQRKMTRPRCYDRVMPRSGKTRLLHSCFTLIWLRHETITELCHSIVITGQDHDSFHSVTRQDHDSFHSVTRHLGYVMRRLWIHRVMWRDCFITLHNVIRHLS